VAFVVCRPSAATCCGSMRRPGDSLGRLRATLEEMAEALCGRILAPKSRLSPSLSRNWVNGSCERSYRTQPPRPECSSEQRERHIPLMQ
jgi:hypothetical protein